MINTYQTSVPPPPLPPRLSRTNPVLVPPLASSTSHSKALLRFLVGAVLLQLLLSVGGFIFLYHTDRTDRVFTPEGKAAKLSSEETPYSAMARMVIKQPPRKQQEEAGYLQWNIDHSVQRNIDHYQSTWLTVRQPGDYYVYSRITFSKPKVSLTSWIRQRESESEEDRVVMKSYCTLGSNESGLCTAAQGQVVTLQAGAQLSVWVQDLSCVDYDEGANTFGMYKL